MRRPDDLDLVRESYDRVADNYVEMVATTALGDIRLQPWLRAAMDTFADAVAGLGPVLDVGCGPGTVTAYLAERGLDVSGVDLSPRMIEHARRLHPGCRFSVASSTELDLADSSLAARAARRAGRAGRAAAGGRAAASRRGADRPGRGARGPARPLNVSGGRARPRGRDHG